MQLKILTLLYLCSCLNTVKWEQLGPVEDVKQYLASCAFI